jgi:hypothetical protein
MGVELETDRGPNPTRNVYGGEVAGYARPSRFWIPKADVSVTGPEFCSFPATMAYWRYIRGNVGEMFTAIRHSGYRSYDTGSCGMHVNINREAFATRTHWLRFVTLLTIAPAWTRRVARRTQGQIDAWAHFNLYSTPARRRAFAFGSFGAYGSGGSEHTSAINATNGGRFELRFPRGTLSLLHFYATLEVVDAAYWYTEGTTIGKCRPKHFMAYLAENAARWPDAARFMGERFPNGYGGTR